MLRKIALAGVSLGLAAVLAFCFGASNASANKVDCSKVMAERSAGKKAKDIAKEMNISTSSVYRCKQKMAKSSSASAKTAAAASPAAKPSSASK